MHPNKNLLHTKIHQKKKTVLKIPKTKNLMIVNIYNLDKCILVLAKTYNSTSLTGPIDKFGFISYA